MFNAETSRISESLSFLLLLNLCVVGEEWLLCFRFFVNKQISLPARNKVKTIITIWPMTFPLMGLFSITSIKRASYTRHVNQRVLSCIKIIPQRYISPVSFPKPLKFLLLSSPFLISLLDSFLLLSHFPHHFKNKDYFVGLNAYSQRLYSPNRLIPRWIVNPNIFPPSI